MRLFMPPPPPRLGRLTRTVALLICAGPLSATSVVAQADQGITRQAALLAQREAKRDTLAPERVSQTEERVRAFETLRLPRAIFVKGFNGLRPVLGGLPGGSGFVFGGGYINSLNRRAYEFTTDARYSTLGYKQADINVVFPNERSTSPVSAGLRAEYRDFTELNYFGLGTGSSVDDRAFYRIEDRTMGADVTFNSEVFDAGATVGLWNGRIDSGSRLPSLEDEFDPSNTPGFEMQPDFLRYGAHAIVTLLDGGLPPRSA